MDKQTTSQDTKPRDENRAERLNQVRHLQTLRWAYLSTYLAGLGWFLAIYFQKDSTLSSNRLATFAVSLAVTLLGCFMGIRIFHFTRIIRHDLDKIGTTIRGMGWLEYVFIFLLTFFVFVFGLLVLFGVF